MTNLESALIESGQADNQKEANELVREMYERVKGGFESPADVLEEYDLEPDYVEDLLNWKQFGSSKSGYEPDLPSGGKSGKTELSGEDEEKLMYKVKKLLDKAASSDSQAEADAFMEKAQQLIHSNSLNYERIVGIKGEMRNGKIVDEAILEEIIKYEEVWNRKLIENIAKGSMCKVLYGANGSNRIHVIGKSSNASSVLMLVDFYQKAIMNLAVKEAQGKTLRGKMALRSSGKAITGREIARLEKEEAINISDYLLGAVDGLDDALTKKTEIFSSETFSYESETSGVMQLVTGKELIIKNRNKIDEYIAMKYPRLGHASLASGGGNRDSHSYSKGHAAGGGLGSSQKRLG